MKNAVQAILRHMTSTDDDPDHSLCPVGVNSWCSYNRALSNDQEPAHHKDPFPACVKSALEPVFERLGDEDLLKRCSDGKTQNASESLHSVIWSMTSKNCHASLKTVKRAVALYNQGRTATNERASSEFGFSPGSCPSNRSLEKDRIRVNKARKTFLEERALKEVLGRRHGSLNSTQDYCPGLL